MSITRTDARQLLSEHSAAEARKAELRAAAEKAAVEADREFRRRLGRGVPIPAGMSYAEAVQSAELDAQSYRPHRMSLVEDLLDNSGSRSIPSSTVGMGRDGSGAVGM